jgi:23S rRNA pseudouridine1911/1915/1917 synthase
MRILSPATGRIDKVLSQALGYSRNQIEHLIDAGCVKVEGKEIKKGSFKVKESQEIEYIFLEAEKEPKREVDFDIETLFEDEDILIINKPANLVVHPAPSVKEPTVVDWLIKKGISLSTIYGKERYGIVHRIDKDTTGALVIAKNNQAHLELSKELQSKKMGRYYTAVIDYPLKDNLTIDKPIARNPKNRLKMGVVEGGKEAKSDFLKIAQSKREFELIGVRLHTGRTHQIRVHLNSINRVILGDRLYGYKKERPKRLFLHAKVLYLTHPKTKKKLMIEAPLFEDMERFLVDNFDRRDIDGKTSKEYLHNSFNDIFGSL